MHQVKKNMKPRGKFNNDDWCIPDEFMIVPIREMSYNDAKKEISAYIEKTGYRKVYISELAEELVIEFELIEEIMEEMKICDNNIPVDVE